LVLNGQEVSDHPLLSYPKDQSPLSELEELEAWLKEFSLAEMVDLLDDLDEDDYQYLYEGVQINTKLAAHGLNHGLGLAVGKTMQDLVKQKSLTNDMVMAAKILTSAASDARMSGAKLPAMTSSGSGNQGCAATLPIWAVKDYLDCEEKSVLKAICLSHIITAYIKAHTGRLSALCGSSIAAGTGSAAGITYLFGGTIQQIAWAIKYHTMDLAGVICDGAKASCALKLATTAGTAVQAALFSIQNDHMEYSKGIVGVSPEQTMQNIGTLNTHGMIEADRTILQILLDKKLSTN
jgi:L-cysteine desulfidase